MTFLEHSMVPIVLEWVLWKNSSLLISKNIHKRKWINIAIYSRNIDFLHTLATQPHNSQTMSNDAKTDATGTNDEKKSFLGDLLQGKTPGVSNIEAAYTRAGASNHNTPGYASKLGSQEQNSGGTKNQGVGTDKFAESISDQRREVGT